MIEQYYGRYMSSDFGARMMAEMDSETEMKTEISEGDFAKHALKRINETFPGKKESQHPLVVLTRVLVLAKDCGIDVTRDAKKKTMERGSRKP